MAQTLKKYTVITGASAGIGCEIAKAFAHRGKNLIIIARRKERLEALKDEILNSCPMIDIVVLKADLSCMENVHLVYESLRNFYLENWINNAGFGSYGSVAKQDLKKVENMLHVNVEALTIFSSLFVRDYMNEEGTQLINVSSAGGYTIVPNAVIYCAAKFFVSAFTEGLAWELKQANAKMQVKVLAPAATKTEFGNVANSVSDYDYEKSFGSYYHTSQQMAAFLMELFDSSHVVGAVDRETLKFQLRQPLIDYAYGSVHNQIIRD